MNIRVELTVGLGEAQVEVMRTAYKRPSRKWETLIMSAMSPPMQVLVPTLPFAQVPMSKLIKLIQMPLRDRKHRYLNLQAQLTPVLLCQKLQEL